MTRSPAFAVTVMASVLEVASEFRQLQLGADFLRATAGQLFVTMAAGYVSMSANRVAAHISRVTARHLAVLMDVGHPGFTVTRIDKVCGVVMVCVGW